MPSRWYSIQNATGDVAELSIFDEVSPWGVTARDFVTDLSQVTARQINLHLNTPGGDVYDGIAIFNALKDHPAHVKAYIPGLAASIGTVIAMAADEITIAPHARMMIHDAWAMAAGNAEDMSKLAERLEATSENIASIYAERAGGSPADWRALMKAETWYTDQQAVDAGLADAVGRSNDTKALRNAALFDLSRFRQGDREAALLRADVIRSLPETSEPQVETPEEIDEHAQARMALEAAIQGVSKEAYL